MSVAPRPPGGVDSSIPLELAETQVRTYGEYAEACVLKVGSMLYYSTLCSCSGNRPDIRSVAKTTVTEDQSCTTAHGLSRLSFSTPSGNSPVNPDPLSSSLYLDVLEHEDPLGPAQQTVA